LLPDVSGEKFWELPEHHKPRKLSRLAQRGISFAPEARPNLAARLQEIGLQKRVPRTIGLLNLLNRGAAALERSRLLCSEGYVFRPDMHVERRISAVCRHLIKSDREVADIAFMCGFESLSNFSRWFGSAHKTIPSGFRASHHQLNNRRAV
jgi:AraC-like DNA-binding protein